MTTVIAPESKETTPEIQLPPTELIYDDGEPMESNRHRIAMNLLINSIEQDFVDRDDFFVGGNMFIYYTTAQVKNKDFRGPDFFLVLDTHRDNSRKAWVVWEENGRYPDVIIELMSPSTAKIDREDKKELYQKVFKTREYYIYDPFDRNSLQGWRLDSNFVYQEILPNEKGWLWCETTNLWLGTWEGSLLKEQAHWLRFYHNDGTLALLPEEFAQLQAQQAQIQAQQAQIQAQQAQIQAQETQLELEKEREKAQRLAERLRELGENPENY
ncbi:Uma2 family endonuclease [Geminocystis sp. CENA526]|uniref:Uma2 family endonuclease n=1 Tax=Geminocystis sp. CENA526 TaxID=1355871 RepID=UPI003D6F109C